MSDYYEILQVSRNADEKQIRRSFRKLARQYHPDLNRGDKKAEAKFKEMNEAYEVLSDSDSRRKYDRYGENWKQFDRLEAQRAEAGGTPFEWSSRSGRPWSTSDSGEYSRIEDLLEGIGDPFGRRRRAPAATRAEAAVDVNLEEAFRGTRRNLTITTQGRERRIEVTIPPGVDTGSVVRVSPGQGQELLLTINVTPHRRFTRQGNDISTDLQVRLEDAILGGEAEVRTLDKKIRVTVPAESQNGQRIRLKGQGIPKLGSKDDRGDLYVVLRPKMPKNMTAEERDLVQEFKALQEKKR